MCDLSVEFNSDIYSINAIKKAAYDFSGKAWIDITKNYNTIKVLIKLKTPKDLNDTIHLDFRNHVLDHQVRIDTAKEFKIIREILIAQAFEPCDNLREVVKYLIDE